MSRSKTHDAQGTGTGTGGGGRPPDEVRNEVVLVGRLAAPGQERTLPSGDRLVAFRLVVPRPRPGRTAQRRASGVDTIDCSAWSVTGRRQVLGWATGDVVQVSGALRRRFWRGPGGAPASRYEVEVDRARRVRRATMDG